MAKKKKIKKSEDLEQLLQLSKVPTHTKEYTTIFGEKYSVTFDKEFTIAKIQECVEEYFVIQMCANKFNTDEEIQVNSSLLFSILIQKFTDKNFILNNDDPMDKFQKYSIVASTLHSIELNDGMTLYQRIICDFGQENLDKVKVTTESFAKGMDENKEEIQKMLQPLMKEGEEDGDEEISDVE